MCSFFFTVRVKQIQNELGTQILADFEEALSVKGVKVHCIVVICLLDQ